MKIQKKPYEISIWTTVSDEEGNLIEKKLGVIGSSEIEDSPIRALEPHLVENINGSKTLTFSIFWRFYNVERQRFESNPWEKYLVNERRIKLKYDGEWYEFVIKDVEESKEEYKKTFTCTSAPILELSRNGYKVELNDSLYNNQGTAIELAQRILDDSDWVVDVDNCDKIYSTYKEHLYSATTTKNIKVTNIKTGEELTIEADSKVYLFYSEVENNGSKLQLLWNWETKEDGTPANLDSENTIINEPIYLYNGNKDSAFTLGDLSLTYKGERLVLSQLGHYDEVLKAYVKDYDLNGVRKYGYTQTEYLTSDIVGDLVNNGKDYALPQSAEGLTSWKTYIDNWYASSGASVMPITFPGIGDMGDINTGSNINLETDPESVMVPLMVWKLPTPSEYIYNTKIHQNLNFLPSGIIKGNKYVFRIKYCLIETANLKQSGYMDEVPKKAPTGHLNLTDIWKEPVSNSIRCALYKNGKQLKGMSGVAVTCNTAYIDKNGASKSGFKGVEQSYERVEGIVGVTNPQQEGWYQYNPAGNPYFFKTSLTEYDGETTFYEFICNKKTYMPYYYGIMTADASYSKEELNDPTLQLRFYLSEYNLNDVYRILVEDVQFFPYMADVDPETGKDNVGYRAYVMIPYENKNSKYIIGDTPTGFKADKDNRISWFYAPGSPLISGTRQTLKLFDPATNINKVYETGYTWEAEFTNINSTGNYKPVYNDYLAINSISGEKSNYYNLVQEICETFQCWADFRIDHDEKGNIIKKDYYYLSPDILPDLDTTYYRKLEDGSYSEVTDYDPTNPDNYYNPQALGWYEKKTTGKTVVLKNYIGKDNYAGFRYGVNLESISRSLDSNSFVSKMIVANNDIEGLESGTCSIERAEKNPTGTSAVYDFSYYTRQQLLDPDVVAADLYLNRSGKNDMGFYPKTKALTTQHRDITTKWVNASNTMITEGARKDTYQAEKNAAAEEKADALEDLCNFIRGLQGLGDTYKNLYPSSTNATSLIQKFVKAYWDKDPEHNNTINYWVKYVTAAEDLNNAIKNYNDANTRYKNAEATYKKLTQQLRKIEKDIEILNKKFVDKYGNFIQEGTWNDADATDDEIYYYDAVNVLRTSAQPQVSYQINVIDLSELEGYKPYTFAIGDKTYIEDTEFFGWQTNGAPYREEVVVSQIDWALDDPASNSITIQNYRTQFEDLFQRLSATVQNAELNQNAYNRATSIIQPSGKIDQAALQKTLLQDQNKLEMGFGAGTITQNGEGILIEGLGSDKNSKIKITGKGIFISKDSGDTWTPVMRGAGTNASTMTSGSLDVSNINIIDGNSPTFQWNGDGLTAYGFEDIYYLSYDLPDESEKAEEDPGFNPKEAGLYEKGRLIEEVVGLSNGWEPIEGGGEG